MTPEQYQIALFELTQDANLAGMSVERTAADFIKFLVVEDGEEHIVALPVEFPDSLIDYYSDLMQWVQSAIYAEGAQ